MWEVNFAPDYKSLIFEFKLYRTYLIKGDKDSPNKLMKSTLLLKDQSYDDFIMAYNNIRSSETILPYLRKGYKFFDITFSWGNLKSIDDYKDNIKKVIDSNIKVLVKNPLEGFL
jgi:hypothetical protein